MRRRLALLVSATMALMLFAFMLPLAILIRVIVSDVAVADAKDEVRSVSAQVAADPAASSVRGDIAVARRHVTVFLPGHRPVGQERRTVAVRLAQARNRSFTVDEQHGQEILVAVQLLPHGGTAVITTFVGHDELTKGVTAAWLILAALGLILFAIGVTVANLLVGTVTRPISELARVSHVLAGGDLGARAEAAGPPEVRELALGLNHLAGRIRELLWQERESVADLSHRLRTPLTALQLELEAMADSADPDGRLSAQVQALDGAVTSLIEDARTRGSTEPRSCDAVDVTAQRAAFWSLLAEDQGRTMVTELADGPVPVGVPGTELGACLDALLGNVFAHTPQRTSFAVRLRRRRAGGGILSVHDDGPGFAHQDPVRRGISGAGSTGLGLDIARQTAEASGGSLTIQAGPGGHVTVELGPPPEAAPGD